METVSNEHTRRTTAKRSKKSVKTKATRTVSTYTGTRNLKPNMSRRTRDPKLYAFPSFDRCDSLLYFPSSLARHLNCGDIPAIEKLFRAHFGKTYDLVSFKSPEKISLADSLRDFAFLDELHPDQITCIHSTKVDGNKISAVGYMKFTHSKSINQHVAKLAEGTNFTCMLKSTWEEQVRRRVAHSVWPEAHKRCLLRALEAGSDFLMYSRFEIDLTIDVIANKITSMRVKMEITSMHEVKPCSSDFD